MVWALFLRPQNSQPPPPPALAPPAKTLFSTTPRTCRTNPPAPCALVSILPSASSAPLRSSSPRITKRTHHHPTSPPPHLPLRPSRPITPPYTPPSHFTHFHKSP